MKIQTKYNGEVEIKEEDIIHFDEGIPSFEEEKKFVVLPFSEDGTFLILQSIQNEQLAFVVISPFDFFSDYQVKLTDTVVSKLKIENQEDIAIFLILTIKDPFHLTTANLRGPIIINSKEKQGKQFVVNEEKYTTKHLIMSQSPEEQEAK